jgi:hypothetical protein
LPESSITEFQLSSFFVRTTILAASFIHSLIIFTNSIDYIMVVEKKKAPPADEYGLEKDVCNWYLLLFELLFIDYIEESRSGTCSVAILCFAH